MSTIFNVSTSQNKSVHTSYYTLIFTKFYHLWTRNHLKLEELILAWLKWTHPCSVIISNKNERCYWTFRIINNSHKFFATLRNSYWLSIHVFCLSTTKNETKQKQKFLLNFDEPLVDCKVYVALCCTKTIVLRFFHHLKWKRKCRFMVRFEMYTIKNPLKHKIFQN